MKNGCNWRYKNIDIKKAISALTYSGFLSLCYKIIFGQFCYRKIDTSRDVMVFYSYIDANRDDYDDLINSFYDFIPVNEKELIILKRKFKFQFLFKFIFMFIKTIVEHKNVIVSPSCSKNIFLISLAKVNIDAIEVMLDDIDVKLVVTFCDALFEDSLITQVAKEKGIKTATLQHGQYHIVNKDVPENLALNNLVSDYLFSWGKATVNEYKSKVNGPTKVVPVGICSNSYRISKNYANNSNEKYSFNGFKVLLNADNNYEQNVSMIKCIIDYCDSSKLTFSIQFHPKNDKNKYLPLLNKTLNFIDGKYETKNRLSILYTSGVLVKLLSNAENFLLFKTSETPDIFKNSIPGFCDQNSFIKVLNFYLNDKQRYLVVMDDAQKYFIADGDSADNYRQAVLDILEGD